MHPKILVTGAEGFIGSHLVEMLVREGYSVRAFVLYNSFNSWGWQGVKEWIPIVRSATAEPEDLGVINIIDYQPWRLARSADVVLAGCDLIL